jgi:hypothetical protein
VLEVNPVLVPRPGADRLAKRLSQALPRPRRAQVVSRNGSFSILPSRPGDGVDADILVAALEKAALTNVRTLSPALTHVEPTLTTPAAEAAVAEARALVDQPVALTFQGQDVGSLSPRQLAKLVRFRVGVEASGSGSTRNGWQPSAAARPWRRGQSTPVRRRRQASLIRPPDPASLSTAGGGRLGRRRRIIVQPRLIAPEADPGHLTTRGRKLGIRQRIPPRPTWGRPSNRITTQLMADYIDGTIVRPGDPSRSTSRSARERPSVASARAR